MTAAASERRKKSGAERRERTRRKLLSAAARVVAEKGEGNASINDFIKAAGVSRGTFYNYYTAKEQIIDDLWVKIGRRPFIQIRELARRYSDPAERLSVGFRLALERGSTDPTWGWIAYALTMDAGTAADDIMTFPGPDLLIGREMGRFKFDDLESVRDLTQGSTLLVLRGLLLGTRSPDCIEPLITLILTSLGLDSEEAHEIVQRPLPPFETFVEED